MAPTLAVAQARGAPSCSWDMGTSPGPAPSSRVTSRALSPGATPFTAWHRYSALLKSHTLWTSQTTQLKIKRYRESLFPMSACPSCSEHSIPSSSGSPRTTAASAPLQPHDSSHDAPQTPTRVPRHPGGSHTSPVCVGPGRCRCPPPLPCRAGTFPRTPNLFGSLTLLYPRCAPNERPPPSRSPGLPLPCPGTRPRPSTRCPPRLGLLRDPRRAGRGWVPPPQRSTGLPRPPEHRELPRTPKP